MVQVLVSLAVGIFLLILLVVKTKVHPILAIVFSAAFIGVAGGLPIDAVAGHITAGFGDTLAGIGLVIGFGVMMGQIMEESGAARVMARTFLKVLKNKHEELALALTGFFVSIPIFADSGFVILSPLAKAISKSTKKSLITLGSALAVGLCLTHVTVPPTPGPLGVAGIYGINVGQFMLFSLAMGIPLVFVVVLTAKYTGKKYFKIVNENDEIVDADRQKTENYVPDFGNDENLPSVFMSFAPILIPILLILMNTVLGAFVSSENVVLVVEIAKFIGSPVLAVGIGLLIAIYGLVPKADKDTVSAIMEKGICSSGTILLVTGAGGSLGRIIQESGAGQNLAEVLINSPIHVLILPFIISAALKIIQGSGTVAMTTAASLTAPILIPMGVNPMFAAYAACIGSQCGSIFNDSMYWIFNRTLGLTKTKEQMECWCLPLIIMAVCGMAELLIVNAIFG